MLVYQRVSPPKKTLILGDAQKKHLRIRSEARQRWRSQRHRANSPRAEGCTRPRWGSHSAPLEAPGPEQQLSGHGEFSKNESSWHRKKNLGNKKKNTMSDSLSLGSNLIQSPVGSQLAASWHSHYISCIISCPWELLRWPPKRGWSVACQDGSHCLVIQQHPHCLGCLIINGQKLVPRVYP